MTACDYCCAERGREKKKEEGKKEKVVQLK